MLTRTNDSLINRIQALSITESFNCNESDIIGKGNYATVYQNQYKDEPVAIKVINRIDICVQEIHVNAHIQEMIEIDKTSLSVTVPFYGYEQNKLVFMLMEMTLTDFIKSEAYNDQDIFNFAADVIKALEFLHLSANIIWCDGKADNILIKDKCAYIGDLGLSVLNDPFKINKINGTQQFFAPELLTRRSYNTYASDIWALGLILYHSITKKCPFDELKHLTDAKFIAVISQKTGLIRFTPEETARQPLLTKFSLLACEIHPNNRPSANKFADEIRTSLTSR